MSRTWLTTPEEVPDETPRYEARKPGRLWSVLDMIRFEAGVFFDLANTIKNIQALAFQATTKGYGGEPAADFAVVPHIQKAALDCEKAGLPSSLKLARRMIEEVRRTPGTTLNELGDRLATLAERISDDLDSLLVLRVECERIRYYEQSALFGDAVAKCFNTAMPDAEEAGNCFALGRYTAAVFHLMRVLEAGLLKLAAIAEIHDHKPSWNRILTEIERIMQKTRFPDRSPQLQKHSRFLDQVLPHMRAINDAWRDKVAHFEDRIIPTEEYTEDKAEVILKNTGALMKLLTNELNKP